MSIVKCIIVLTGQHLKIKQYARKIEHSVKIVFVLQYVKNQLQIYEVKILFEYYLFNFNINDCQIIHSTFNIIHSKDNIQIDLKSKFKL